MTEPIELLKIEIEVKPPPLGPGIDPQLADLLSRMKPEQAVVLSAAVAYKALIKALGMGFDVDLRVVPESDTKLRLYMLGK